MKKKQSKSDAAASPGKGPVRPGSRLHRLVELVAGNVAQVLSTPGPMSANAAPPIRDQDGKPAGRRRLGDAENRSKHQGTSNAEMVSSPIEGAPVTSPSD